MAKIKNKKDFLSYENLSCLIETATYDNPSLSILLPKKEKIEDIEYPECASDKKAYHLVHGGSIIIRDETAFQEGEEKYDFRVDIDDIGVALDKFIWECPYSFAELVKGTGDLSDADAFFQVVMYGKVIYG